MEIVNCKQSFKDKNLYRSLSDLLASLSTGGESGDVKVKTLLTFTLSCDLHFRFAFPWYSYSPTLKLRQLDMSRQGMDQGQNLPVYVHWRTGVGV